MKNFSTKNCLNEAFKTLKIARDEAEIKGDIENLLNIGITFYEFATKVPAELHEHEQKVKQKIGFVEHENE